MGGTHDNPTVKEFQQNTQALRVVNSFCRDVIKGNCRGNKATEPTFENEAYPLPKRSSSKSKSNKTHVRSTKDSFHGIVITYTCKY